MKVVPEKTYSVKEAARYLGVHRCTIYAYIRYMEKPLAFLKIPDKAQTPTESVRSLGASPPQYLCI